MPASTCMTWSTRNKTWNPSCRAVCTDCSQLAIDNVCLTARPLPVIFFISSEVTPEHP